MGKTRLSISNDNPFFGRIRFRNSIRYVQPGRSWVLERFFLTRVWVKRWCRVLYFFLFRISYNLRIKKIIKNEIFLLWERYWWRFNISSHESVKSTRKEFMQVQVYTPSALPHLHEITKEKCQTGFHAPLVDQPNRFLRLSNWRSNLSDRFLRRNINQITSLTGFCTKKDGITG